jgi:hypothetical protein
MSYAKYCRYGRLAMTSARICGVCHNERIMRDWRYMAFCGRFNLLHEFAARPIGRPRRRQEVVA